MAFMFAFLCLQSKLENDNKGQNVKRGLRARVEMGLWPCVPPTGYLVSNLVNEKAKCILDTERAPIIKKCFEKIGYEKTKQTGSHMKLTKKFDIGEHHITIPNHNSIKVGTLNSIIKDLSESLKLSKDEIYKILF